VVEGRETKNCFAASVNEKRKGKNGAGTGRTEKFRILHFVDKKMKPVFRRQANGEAAVAPLLRSAPQRLRGKGEKQKALGQRGYGFLDAKKTKKQTEHGSRHRCKNKRWVGEKPFTGKKEIRLLRGSRVRNAPKRKKKNKKTTEKETLRCKLKERKGDSKTKKKKKEWKKN